MAERDYIVLRRDGVQGGRWDELGVRPAYSAGAARKAAAAELNGDELEAGVELVAVSAQLWLSSREALTSKTETRIVPA